MAVLRACPSDSWTSARTVLGWVAETNAPAWRAQTTDVCSLPVLEAGGKVWAGLLSPEACVLAVQPRPSSCVLTWLSLCASVSWSLPFMTTAIVLDQTHPSDFA